MSDLFRPRAEGDVARLVARHPLAWVVSTGGEPAATPLPLLAETDAAGRVVALFGHFARANPQVALLERDPRATILFQGPNGYVPARHVSQPDWGPTWNYAVVRFDTDLRFVPEETAASVERLAAALEGDQAAPWTAARMGARVPAMLRRIVAFRATVRAERARFKLGQDEQDATFDQIVAGLEDRELADWMTLTVRGGPA